MKTLSAREYLGQLHLLEIRFNFFSSLSTLPSYIAYFIALPFPFPVPSKSCLLSAHLSTIRGVFPLSDFTLKSENLLHIIELFERCCSNRRGFTLKPPKLVDRHTIDNFLKELKSYSLVLFPGTAATVLFEIVRKSGNFLTCETKCCVISCG